MPKPVRKMQKANAAAQAAVLPKIPPELLDQLVKGPMTAEAVDEKVSLVVATATDAGRADAIEMNVRAFMVFITDDTGKALDTLAEFTGAPKDVIAGSPFALVGPTSKLIDDLQARRERWGFSYVIVGQNDVDAFAPVVAALAGT